MAVSQATKKLDSALGEINPPGGVTSHSAGYQKDTKFQDPSGEKIKALVWLGKNTVEIQEIPKPVLVDPEDVILKITGSTVCGSDMHLLHGAIIELEKGDILGHEFMGIVDQVGPGVKKVKPGDRCVASFNIGCGHCWSCKQGLSSVCVKTNTSTVQNAMYGNRTCGMFGYSHCKSLLRQLERKLTKSTVTGGFAGGQAEMARIPHGDANLLKIPDSVPDEDALYL